MNSKLEELAVKALKMATESGDTVKETLSEFQDSKEWEQIRQVAGDLGEEAAVFVRKYPLQSVMGAAAVGFLLGAISSKRRES